MVCERDGYGNQLIIKTLKAMIYLKDSQLYSEYFYSSISLELLP